MKSVVVTGASSGIGRALTQELIDHGYVVFGSVRKSRDAEHLCQEFKHQFIPLLFDLSDWQAIRQAATQVAEMVGDAGLTGMVNNAGIATSGPLMYQDLEEVKQQFDVNVVGCLAVTQAFLPLLGARAHCPHPPGRIITISSIAGRIPLPFLGSYGSSKQAVESMTHTLRQELRPFGIPVSIVAPSQVKTKIFKKESAQGASRYAYTEYGPVFSLYQDHFVSQSHKGLDPMEVARLVRQVLETPKPKIHYAIARDLLADWLIPTRLPQRVVDYFVTRDMNSVSPAITPRTEKPYAPPAVPSHPV